MSQGEKNPTTVKGVFEFIKPQFSTITTQLPALINSIGDLRTDLLNNGMKMDAATVKLDTVSALLGEVIKTSLEFTQAEVQELTDETIQPLSTTWLRSKRRLFWKAIDSTTS